MNLSQPASSAIDIDDFERAKKRAKVEKILSLSHQDGMQCLLLLLCRGLPHSANWV